MVSAVGVICIIIGAIILFFGLGFLAWSFSLPVLFAGQYLILGGLVTVAGIVLIVLGARTGKKRTDKVQTITCKNCSSSNPSTSEFCSKCGIKIS